MNIKLNAITPSPTKINAIFDRYFADCKRVQRERILMGGKDRYTIKREFAEGGMSKIFLVEGEKGGVLLLKEIGDLSAYSSADRDNIYRRFFKEITIVSKINSPYVVKIIDREPMSIEHRYPTFYVMELIKGKDLYAYVPAMGIPPQDTVEIVLRQTLQGLIDFASAAGTDEHLAHRDLKPENIRIELNEAGDIVRAVLIDFGIVKLPQSSATQTGYFMGTLDYTAPEVLSTWSSKQADQRSDIYALGLISYFMLTGSKHYTFGDERNVAVYNRISAFLQDPEIFIGPMRSNLNQLFHIPPRLRQIVFKALAINPDDRFQTYTEFQAALRNWN